jgi:hypothetical protein
MVTLAKNFKKTNLWKTVQNKRTQHKHTFLAPSTLLLAASVSFNAAYCMKEEFTGDTKKSSTKVIEEIDPVLKIKDKNLTEAQLLKKIREGMEIVDESLSDLNKLQEKKIMNIFIGSTGAGKSTIYDYQHNADLIAEFNTKYEKIVINNSVIDSKKRHGFASDTTYPRVNIETGYIDCPGSQNTDGSTQSILNAYSIHKLFKEKKIKKFRLILTVPASHFDTKGDLFVSSIEKNIKNMFPNDLEEIKKGLCLIVTACEKEQTITGFQTKIRKINKKHFELCPFKKNLFNFLSDEKNASTIALFPKVTEKGSLAEMELFRNLKLITQTETNYIDISKISPEISISGKGKKQLEALKQRLEEGILDFCKKELKNSVDKLVTHHTGSAEKLREFFTSYLNKEKEILSKNLLSEEEKEINNIKNLLKKIDKHLSKKESNYSEDYLVSKFSDLIKERNYIKDNFFIKINSIQQENKEKTSNIDNVKEIDFLKSLTDFKLYAVKPQFEPHATCRNFKGKIIGISDIKEQLTDFNKITQVTVLSNILIVDDSIKLPTINVILAAPFWNITTEATIDLQGKNASDDVENGDTGKPGNPGETGGNFYGIASKIENSEKLTINTSGGKGGNGQKGTKGDDGEDGKDGSFLDVEGRNNTCSRGKKPPELSNTLDRIISGVSKRTYETFISEGTRGEKGADGGRAGCRGYGGRAGTIDFSPNIEDLQITRKRDHGDDGIDGKPGEPGKGGRHGISYKGVYMIPTLDGFSILSTSGGLSTLVGGVFFYNLEGNLLQSMWKAPRDVLLPALIAFGAKVVLNCLLSKEQWSEKPKEYYFESERASPGKECLGFNRKEPSQPNPINEMEIKRYISDFEEIIKNIN